MPNPTPSTSAARSSLPQVPTLSTSWKVAISVALAVHLLAVFAGPFSVEPSSMLSGYLWRALRPYLEAAYLNHGYHFFAPEPGPSHLIRYVAELPDGTTREGIFPNLAEHQPRLFYHRHFMMSEFINASPPESEIEKAYAASYAGHLLDEFDATKVTLVLRRHLIPPPQAIIDGATLRDERFYEERTLGTFTRNKT
ncbi:MAG: hypothetical protein KF708_22955 [Pirellulales bacterium]|nr:hypothetical protein [Pirellulales bacterium]